MATDSSVWNDPEFLSVYDSVQEVTFLDRARLFQLWDLIELVELK